METSCSPGYKKEKTLRECIESLECLFKSYQKDSEFNYQLSVDDSPFNILKKAVLEQERSMSSSLESAFQDYCFECGSGEEYVLDYIKAHDNEPKALLEEAKKLNRGHKAELIGIVLRTDYNTCCSWFKSFLKHCIKEGDAYLKHVAESWYDFYKKGFDKVEDLE